MRKLPIVFLWNLATILLLPSLCFAVETALTVTELSETAIIAPFENADNANGNSYQNRTADASILLLLPVGSAGTATVTITAQNTVNPNVPGWGPLTKADIVVALNVGEQKLLGPLAVNAWNDSNGDVIISYAGTGAADVDVAVVRANP